MGCKKPFTPQVISGDSLFGKFHFSFTKELWINCFSGGCRVRACDVFVPIPLPKNPEELLFGFITLSLSRIFMKLISGIILSHFVVVCINLQLSWQVPLYRSASKLQFETSVGSSLFSSSASL